MVIDEGFLQRSKLIVAYRPGLRIDVDDAELSYTRVVEIEDRGEPKLEIGRLECGVALDQRKSDDLLLAEEGLPIPAEGIIGARRYRGLRGDGCRDARRLVQGVADRAEVKEPVFAEYRFVRFESIGVVGIEDVLLPTQRIENAPAIRDRDRDAGGNRLRRQDGSPILDRLHWLGRRRQSWDPAIHLADAIEPFQVPAPIIRLGFGLERHPLKLFIGKFSLEHALYFFSDLRVGYRTLE